MQFKTREIFMSAMLAVGLPISSSAADNTGDPNRPIRIVVPFPPGGITDQLARDVSHALAARLKQPVIVDNKPGAGGNIGAINVARSPGDGYSLLFGTFGTLPVNKSLYANPGYDPLKDFAPVAGVAYLPNVLLVHPQVPANNVAELIALAKKSPGELTYGSFGNGSSAHLAGELFAHMAGINISHIPYKGSPAAMTDLIGGRLTMMFDSIPTALPIAKDGRARALAITTTARSEKLPNQPPMSDTVPGYELTAWFGVAAPASTPKPIVDRLNAEITAALNEPAFRNKLTAQGAVPFAQTPAQFKSFIDTQYQKWDTVIKQANIRLD